MLIKERPFLGAHVSAARSASSLRQSSGPAGQAGLVNAILNGERIGAECIQIFGASPRSYGAPLPSKEDVKVFQQRWRDSSIATVFQHGAYLPNLGTNDPIAMRRSIGNLSAHLEIANLIGSGGVIFHVGSPNGGDRKEALERAAAAMKEILKNAKGDAQLIMENSGSQKKIGGSIADLDFLFKKIGDSRVKVCVDTAHSFESGLIESYTPANIKKFFDAWDEAVGVQNIVAMHINDSKTPYNSQNDKHENLGEGQIGLAGFRALAAFARADKYLSKTSWFLEVPGFDDLGPDKRNVDILKSCFE